jgi:PEP-CTERM motif
VRPPARGLAAALAHGDDGVDAGRRLRRFNHHHKGVRKVLLRKSALAFAATVIAASAAAETVTFTGFAHGYQAVNGVLSSPNTPTNLNVRAGGFHTVLGSESFVSYCVDFYQYLPSFGAANSSYALTDAAAFFGTRLDAVARLFSGRHADVDTAVEEAAFQVALWEIFYESPANAYNTSAGAARFSDAGDDARALAQTYLDGLPGYGNQVALHVLRSGSKQDVVWATPVPEPATVTLLAAGLGFVGWTGRRRRLRG